MDEQKAREALNRLYVMAYDNKGADAEYKIIRDFLTPPASGGVAEAVRYFTDTEWRKQKFSGDDKKERLAYREYIQTLIRAATAAQGQGWRDIATCPKEKGVPILILDIEDVADIGWWNGDFMNRDGYMVQPDYWMPLPPSPPAEKGGA